MGIRIRTWIVGGCIALVAAGLSACIKLTARDLRDIGVGSVTCSAKDESAYCSCFTKCISDATDCRCGDE